MLQVVCGMGLQVHCFYKRWSQFLLAFVSHVSSCSPYIYCTGDCTWVQNPGHTFNSGTTNISCAVMLIVLLSLALLQGGTHHWHLSHGIILCAGCGLSLPFISGATTTTGHGAWSQEISCEQGALCILSAHTLGFACSREWEMISYGAHFHFLLLTPSKYSCVKSFPQILHSWHRENFAFLLRRSTDAKGMI